MAANVRRRGYHVTVSVTESMVTGSTLVLVIPTVVTVAPSSSTEAVPAVLVTSMEDPAPGS
ncbi:MAG: hypothetical protein H6517_02745 [Microthrixaceae bacterium]|nr:hypothetical protein [Microthrixaceae bacterium]